MLIAGVLTRGRWVEILQAYGIWIGVLTLIAFALGRLQAGWVVTIAMFSTVFAIPLVVLALRLRTYLRGPNTTGLPKPVDQTVGNDVATRRFSLATITQWSLKEWLGSLALIGAYLGFLLWLGSPSAQEKDILRRQFNLPPEIELTQFRIDRKGKTYPTLEGIVQFTDAQFGTFIETLNDPNVWRPVPFEYGGTTFDGPFSQDALQWNELPVFRRQGWGNLSMRQVQAARNGKYLCFVLRQVDGGDTTPSFRGEACSIDKRRALKTVHVRGLIDYDHKTLHMIIRGFRTLSPREL